MLTLAKFIADRTPKFNAELVEGLCYHRINNAVEYIDQFIRYSVTSKTNTHLEYLGYQEATPKEELKFLFNKASKTSYDIAENDMYLVKYMFRYGDEPEIRENYFYLPIMSKGNTLRLSGNKFLVMPTLADKVVSVGERVIFTNILTAKYNFTRRYHTVQVNGVYAPVPVINAELYKNQSKKLEDTTKAASTIMHYLLANYGYTQTMQMLLGFVPKPVYDTNRDGVVVIESTGEVPKGYIGAPELYKPTRIKFIVEEKDYNSNVSYCLGNLFYLLDNFPERVMADNLDDKVIWGRLMGEIIHSGNHGIAYLTEKMEAHFNDLNSRFDTITINKLKDINIDAERLIELLMVIFRNFNDWIMAEETRSLYNNKSYEVESFVLSHLTSRITRIVLDINKEELRLGGGPLEKITVDKIFKKYFSTRAIFSLKKEKLYVTSIEYSGDHLYFKNTSMVVLQESDFVNVNSDTNTSERQKLTASMATVGSILGLSKKNPTPLVRANPYVRTDKNGTVLPHPEYADIIEATDKLLMNTEFNEDIEIMDELDTEMDSELEEDYEPVEFEEGDNWSEE